MKRAFIVFLGCLGSTGMAATSQDLSVMGRFTPPACDIALSGNGQVDFGEVIPNPTGVTNVPAPITRTFNVNCAGPAYTGFKVIDNRAGTVPVGNENAVRFGLGVDSKGANIGFWFMYLKNIQANGGSGILKTTVNDTTWAVAGKYIESYAATAKIYAFDSATTPTTAPLAVTNASVDMEITAQVPLRTTMDHSIQIVFDGSATFELIYL